MNTHLVFKTSFSVGRTIRQIHLKRAIPLIENEIEQQIKSGKNPKTLPTRRNLGFVRLPPLLELSAQAQLRRVVDSKFRQDAQHLASMMKNVQLVDDKDSKKEKESDIKIDLEIRGKSKDGASYDPSSKSTKEDRDMAKHQLRQLIEAKLDGQVRDWNYYEYDEYSSSLYMAVRLAPNYACIKSVMEGIRDQYPTYEPSSVLDFGSGMGTTMWAVNETWPNAVKEFMNIELSRHQQELCEFLYRGGKETGDPLDHVFHRQYLPASNRVKYDLVVVAFTLTESTNDKLRTSIIENLWQKTNRFLVIIERGNLGGFTAVNDARQLILDISGHGVTRRKIINSQTGDISSDRLITQCHVAAPCPHDLLCPRYEMARKNLRNVCRFKVSFEPLEMGQKKPPFLKEEFSYVVLSKMPLNSNDKRWPRIVEPRDFSKGHIRHKICGPDGCLSELNFSKSKGSKEQYELAKSCNWGDLLPVKFEDIKSSIC